MTYQEYLKKEKLLREQAQIKQLELDKEFAFSNSVVKIGDVFTDHMGSIRVTRIIFGKQYSLKPMCVYIGNELKKNLTSKKSDAYRQAWQSNASDISLRPKFED